MRVLIAIFLISAVSDGATQFRHLRTYGTRDGVRPPRLASRKLAVAATGRPEFPYGLGFPVAVATDAKGSVWITDSATLSVHVFETSGSYHQIRKVGGVPLEQPSGIVSDRAGRVYLVDTLLANVFVFDENGEYDRALVKGPRGTLEAPTAVSLSEDGRTVYVADPGRNAIVALNREGEVNLVIPLTEESREPGAMALIDNRIYVLGLRQHRVGILSSAGAPRGECRWEGVGLPTAFAFDAAQRQFVVGNPRFMVVQIFDEHGREVGAFGQLGDAVDQQRRIENLYVDPLGRIYVVDSHHGKVLVFEAEPEDRAGAPGRVR